MDSRAIRVRLSFLAALLISSACGTQYLFSAYSTALEERLNFSSVQLNTIGSAANYGVYLGKPIFGYIADNCDGKSRPFIASFVIFIGYLCLAMTYEGIFTHSSFLLCALYVFISGMASAAAYVSSLVTIAKNVTSFKGIAFAAPIALTGLTAAIYSEINSLWFKNDTYHFLLFLATSSGICIFIGSWFLVVVPPQDNNDTIVVSNEEGICSSSTTSEISITVEQDAKFENTPLLQNKVKEEIDIGGWDLFYNRDAIIISAATFFISGAGLMYINNVGTIIKSLFFSSSAHPLISDSSQIQKLQNMHVFYLSISSCLGRISAGFMSDFAKILFNLPRIWFFIISGVWLFLAQLLILFYVDGLDKLMIVTVLAGFGFGNLYGITPSIVSELFGTKRFGSNWGKIACIPAFGGQLFNLLFGYNNDQHKDQHCSGPNCYESVFYISAFACLFSVCISSGLLCKKNLN